MYQDDDDWLCYVALLFDGNVRFLYLLELLLLDAFQLHKKVSSCLYDVLISFFFKVYAHFVGFF